MIIESDFIGAYAKWRCAFLSLCKPLDRVTNDLNILCESIEWGWTPKHIIKILWQNYKIKLNSFPNCNWNSKDMQISVFILGLSIKAMVWIFLSKKMIWRWNGWNSIQSVISEWFKSKMLRHYKNVLFKERFMIWS